MFNIICRVHCRTPCKAKKSIGDAPNGLRYTTSWHRPACVSRQARQPGGRGFCLGAGKTRSEKNARKCRTRKAQSHTCQVHQERAGAHFSRQNAINLRSENAVLGVFCCARLIYLSANTHHLLSSQETGCLICLCLPLYSPRKTAHLGSANEYANLLIAV